MTTMGSFRTEEELVAWFNSEPATGETEAKALTGIVKGGSVRRFYRLLGEEEQSLGVLMQFSTEKEENNFYAGISGFLTELGVPVPKILHHDSEKGLAVLQDLGSQDLHAFRDAPWPELKAHYLQILQAVCKIWQAGETDVKSRDWLKLMDGFDARLYTWERDYFFDQCITRLVEEVKPESRDAMHQECQILQELLLKQEVHLVHRDFQSHNIMLGESGPAFVDFQGLRTGTWFYDLASLLYDPYMSLTDNRRDELIGFTAEMMGWPGSDAEFDIILHAAVVQRLMQALGAYGYLGKELEKEEFLGYIPIAAKELHTLATEMGLLEVAQLAKSVMGEKKQNRRNRNRNRRRRSSTKSEPQDN
ncbi:MAG: phosphotransferase [Verrucomicrobiota bacterium]